MAHSVTVSVIHSLRYACQRATYDGTDERRPPDPELPRAVALAWGVAANPQRGPKREMSVERIVDVAVELADAVRVSAVSMSAVAERARLHADVALPVRHGQGRPGTPHAGGAASAFPRRSIRRGFRRNGAPDSRRGPGGQLCVFSESIRGCFDIPISSTGVTPTTWHGWSRPLQVLGAGSGLAERQDLDRARPHRAGAVGRHMSSRGYHGGGGEPPAPTPDDLEIAAHTASSISWSRPRSSRSCTRR